MIKFILLAILINSLSGYLLAIVDIYFSQKVKKSNILTHTYLYFLFVIFSKNEVLDETENTSKLFLFKDFTYLIILTIIGPLPRIILLFSVFFSFLFSVLRFYTIVLTIASIEWVFYLTYLATLKIAVPSFIKKPVPKVSLATANQRFKLTLIRERCFSETLDAFMFLSNDIAFFYFLYKSTSFVWLLIKNVVALY